MAIPTSALTGEVLQTYSMQFLLQGLGKSIVETLEVRVDWKIYSKKHAPIN